MFFVFVPLQDRYELAVIPPMVDMKKPQHVSALTQPI